MELFKVDKDIKYLGMPYDQVKWSINDSSALDELEKNLGYRENFTNEECWAWEEDMKKRAWSDGKVHDMIDLVRIKGQYQFTSGSKPYRSFRRILERLNKFHFQFYQNKNGQMYKYIPVSRVCYRQGWFLKHRFFSRKPTHYICTTYEQMVRFFDKYFDKSDHAKEAKQAFCEAWKPGMLFEVSF